MALIYDTDKSFKQRVKNSIANDFKHQAISGAQDTFYGKRLDQVAQVYKWEDWRTLAGEIRDHTLQNLDYYLNQFAENATKNGSKVYFAQTAQEATAQVLEIFNAKAAKSVVKTKSMVSEEIDINADMLAAGIDVTETDLAEWILQLNDWDHPSHIVVPALHKNREEIREIFTTAGYEGSNNPPELAQFARQTLRQKFLTADIGMTGCNFGVAETGSVTLVTNEGNGRMVSSIPKTQIVLMGMERLVPTFEDLDIFMNLLVKSAVGARLSSYVSVTTGPRKEDEVDGPEEVHIIIVDNGRSKILGSEFRSMLRCIRCGACLNICPVYRHVSGHAYGSIYSGPMGAVLTPLLVGYDKAKDLPYASTLCGACDDHCPVKIPLHSLLLQHRRNIVEKYGKAPVIESMVFKAAGLGLSNAGLYGLGTKFAAPLMRLIAKGDDSIDNKDFSAPVLDEWTQSRNLPVLEGEKFRDWFNKREKKGGK